MQIVKGLLRNGFARTLDAPLELSEDRDLFTVNGASAPFTEISRRGGLWTAISAAGTPLVVIPTTLCILELYNNTQDYEMEIEDLLLFHLLGTAAVHNLSVWGEVTPPVAVAPTLSAIKIASHSGRAPYTAIASSPVIPAAGTTVVSGAWRPYGPPNISATSTALPGEAFEAPVNGKMIVPPRSSLAITCVDALATASSVQVGATWNWKRLTMDAQGPA